MADIDEDLAVIIVCQGPPRCNLDGDAAVEAQMAGCAWCKRITVHADHSETIVEPANA